MENRKLNLNALVAIASGGAVANVITSVMLATAQTGRSAWISYVIAILIGGILRIIPVIIFSSMFRYKGGNYTLVSESLGETFGGIYALWWLPMFLSRGMGASALGEYLKSVFPSIDANMAAIAAITVAFVINLFGLDFMVKIQKKLTLLAGAVLAVYCIFGLMHLDSDALSIGSPSYYLGGGMGVLLAVTLVIQGASAPSLVCGLSWDAENPRRDIPRAILLSNGIMLVICVLVSFVAGNVDVPDLYGKPLTYTAASVMPGILYTVFVVVGPFMCLFASLNSGMATMAAPVVSAVDNGWFPQYIAKRNRHGVPWIIYGVMWLVCVVPLMLGVSLKAFTAYTVIAQRISGMLLVISAFRYPKVFKAEWERSGFHMKNIPYYMLLAVISLVELATLYLAVKNIGFSVFAGNIILVTAFALYAVARKRSGKVHSENMIEESN